MATKLTTFEKCPEEFVYHARCATETKAGKRVLKSGVEEGVYVYDDRSGTTGAQRSHINIGD